MNAPIRPLATRPCAGCGSLTEGTIRASDLGKRWHLDEERPCCPRCKAAMCGLEIAPTPVPPAVDPSNAHRAGGRFTAGLTVRSQALLAIADGATPADLRRMLGDKLKNTLYGAKRSNLLNDRDQLTRAGWARVAELRAAGGGQ